MYASENWAVGMEFSSTIGTVIVLDILRHKNDKYLTRTVWFGRVKLKLQILTSVIFYVYLYSINS